MALTKLLITVTTYPSPSRSYDELVCTAGVLENGKWIRIYPVPLSFLIDLKGSGKVKNVKYTWIELDLGKRTDDFRPESYSKKDPITIVLYACETGSDYHVMESGEKKYIKPIAQKIAESKAYPNITVKAPTQSVTYSNLKGPATITIDNGGTWKTFEPQAKKSNSTKKETPKDGKQKGGRARIDF